MKIIYVYDALCGWCYGFSPVIVQFYQKHRDAISFEVVSGGMITGSRIGPVGEVAPYIRWAYKEVENATGVTFGEAFLNQVLADGQAVFSSIPPAIALHVFTSYRGDEAVLFAAALQKAIYYDGLAPEDVPAYASVAKEFGIDGNTFVAQMGQPAFQAKAQEDFHRTQQLGVKGFPMVLAETDGTYYRLASGYTPLPELENRFATLSQTLP